MSNEFFREEITIDTIDDYNELQDSIKYICDFNGYEWDPNHREAFLHPELPVGGVPENNHFVGYRSRLTNEPCAFIEYYEHFKTNDTVFLGQFFVHAKFHGQGNGRKIFQMVEQHWREQGFKNVVLNVDLKNTVGMLFWVNMGFRTVDESIRALETPEETYYMLRLRKWL